MQAAGRAQGSANAQSDDQDAQVIPDVWDLHIVGDGPERGAIEQLIASAGPQAVSRIHLLGYKSGEDLQREVGNARFTVLSSEWRENMPYSGLESLAAQTPIIGARIGGIPELVEEGKTGVTFESGDAVDLLNSMRKCSAVSASSYSSMQRFCREYVNARCLQNKYALTLIDLYERVI